jgi:hypothetical protein
MRLPTAAVFVGFTLALGCGREPLDPGPTGSAGSESAGSPGSAGSSGSFGRAGATGVGGGGSSASVLPNHRATASTCPTFPPPTVTTCPTPFGSPLECMTNADCTNGVDGRCEGSLPAGGCTCSYNECYSDAACPAAEVCACSNTYSGNTCVPSGCQVDADCGPGVYCSPVADPCTMVVQSYQCRTSGDQCVTDTDCTEGYICAFDSNMKLWACTPFTGCPM